MKFQTTKFTMTTIALAASLSFGAAGIASAQVGTDLKNAGHDTADASKTAAHKTSHGTKKVYHKTAHGTSVAAHKTAHGTKVAAHDTADGSRKVGDKIADRPYTPSPKPQ